VLHPCLGAPILAANFCATFVLLLPGRPTVGHPVDNTFLCYFCATFCTSFAPHLNHLQPVVFNPLADRELAFAPHLNHLQPPFILRRKNVNYEHFVPKEPCIYQAMFCCKWHFGAFHDELLTILCRALFCLAMSHNTNLGSSIFGERYGGHRVRRMPTPLYQFSSSFSFTFRILRLVYFFSAL